MNKQIICMVRSGEAGRTTQDHAIAYTRQTGRQLVFLHIIHPEGLAQNMPGLLGPLREELTWFARVTLNQAKMRAERRGVKAETAIRTGSFFETVLAYAQAHPTDRLYLGKPREETADYEQRLAQIQAFADRLMQSASIEVMLV